MVDVKFNRANHEIGIDFDKYWNKDLYAMAAPTNVMDSYDDTFVIVGDEEDMIERGALIENGIPAEEARAMRTGEVKEYEGYFLIKLNCAADYE